MYLRVIVLIFGAKVCVFLENLGNEQQKVYYVLYTIHYILTCTCITSCPVSIRLRRQFRSPALVFTFFLPRATPHQGRLVFPLYLKCQLFKRSSALVEQNRRVLSHSQFAQRLYLNKIVNCFMKTYKVD